MLKSKLSLIFLSILSLFLLTSSSALAASKVEFAGGAENFVFRPDGNWTETDLFGDLKGLMPGDKRAENIVIENLAADYDYVVISLRAEPSAELNDLLSQLTLNVYNNDELISSAPASEPGALTTNVKLGTLYPGDKRMITAEILVPSSLGNDYMHSDGEIVWVFTAEAYKDGKIAPNTGAMTTSGSGSVTTEIIIGAAAITLTAGTVLLLRRRKSRQ